MLHFRSSDLLLITERNGKELNGKVELKMFFFEQAVTNIIVLMVNPPS